MNFDIVSCDPGKTTGWAMYCAEEDTMLLRSTPTHHLPVELVGGFIRVLLMERSSDRNTTNAAITATIIANTNPNTIALSQPSALPRLYRQEMLVKLKAAWKLRQDHVFDALCHLIAFRVKESEVTNEWLRDLHVDSETGSAV